MHTCTDHPSYVRDETAMQGRDKVATRVWLGLAGRDPRCCCRYFGIYIYIFISYICVVIIIIPTIYNSYIPNSIGTYNQVYMYTYTYVPYHNT